MAKDNVCQGEIDEFNAKIRTSDGKLNLKDLKALNSVYKQEYIGMVLDEDKAI